jgi:putative membrane protein
VNPSQPPKLFGTNNELAKERNRAAAERTMNAWIGQSLTLIGFGVAIDRVYQGIRRQLPETDPLTREALTHAISLMFIALGTVLLALALIQHRLEVKSIEREDYVLQSVSILNHFVVAGVLLSGGLGLVVITLFL